MIEFVKQLQKHNAELMEEIKTLKEEREAILRILDDDKSATRTRTSDTIRNMKPPRTLAEALEEGAGVSVSMSMKFNLLAALYMKTQRENDFTKEEVIFIETLAKQAIKDITDEHYADLLKIAQKSL